MHRSLAFLLIIAPLPVWAGEPIDLVLVLKGERKLQLLAKGKVQHEFKISLGRSPVGHKQQEGDMRTPEGKYVLDYRNAGGAYYKSIHISYPDAEDVKRARRAGVAPGGAIMLHGYPKGKEWVAALPARFDWTYGCVALANADMDIVWKNVKYGTPIELRP
jgi:murein L,D-transpeptidase YafK